MLVMIRSLIIHPLSKRKFYKGYSVCVVLLGYQTVLIYLALSDIITDCWNTY